MPEYVTESHVEVLERYREHVSEHSPRMRSHSARISVYVNELPEEEDAGSYHFERMPSVMELLELMGHRSLKDQVYMVCNLLTISGFTQAEIAAAIGVSPQTYRNALLAVRKDLTGRT